MTNKLVLMVMVLAFALSACTDDDSAIRLDSGPCEQYLSFAQSQTLPSIKDANYGAISVDYAPFQPLWGSAHELHNQGGQAYAMLIDEPKILTWTDGSTHLGTVLRVDNHECMWAPAIGE